MGRDSNTASLPFSRAHLRTMKIGDSVVTTSVLHGVRAAMYRAGLKFESTRGHLIFNDALTTVDVVTITGIEDEEKYITFLNKKGRAVNTSTIRRTECGE